LVLDLPAQITAWLWRATRICQAFLGGRIAEIRPNDFVRMSPRVSDYTDGKLAATQEQWRPQPAFPFGVVAAREVEVRSQASK
jgi:hypothetical protein